MKQIIIESPNTANNDPWEKRKKYEEELKEQLEFNKRKNEERRLKELEEELKFEKRFQEQQEKIKLEFEAEILRKKEKHASRSDPDGKTRGGTDDAETKIPLVERTNSPPVPALREQIISKSYNSIYILFVLIRY